jgi:ABC-type branched-subunit amino acid transport system ATPase component
VADADGPIPFRARRAVLEVDSITVRFGAVEALRDVSLSVRTGSITGLIGPNGAGKTTLIDAVSGFVRTAAGDIRLDGTSIARWAPDRRARAGLSRSFQSLELFDDLTVRENLLCASHDHRTRRMLTSIFTRDRTDLSGAASVAVAAFALDGDLDRRPSDLPLGRRRLVAIARAFALSPSLLMLDEPAAGLGVGEVEELHDALRNLVDQHDVGVLLIEHDVSFVMSLSDEIVVLDFGKMLMSGEPSAVRRSQAVIDAYLGTPVPG